MRSIIKRHPNYVIGFFIWLASIAIVITVPRFATRIKGRTPPPESSYTIYLKSLNDEQRSKLLNFEAGVISVAGEFYLISESSHDEFNLFKRGLLSYKTLDSFIDENTRRLIIINSLLRSMPTDERDLVLAKKAVIIFRNGEFLLIRGKSGVPLR